MKKGARPKSNRNDPICFSAYLYRARTGSNGSSTEASNVIGSQRDKLAADYLAFVQLASIRLWLRADESTP
jgi:hypothetical protein